MFAEQGFGHPGGFGAVEGFPQDFGPPGGGSFGSPQGFPQDHALPGGGNFAAPTGFYDPGTYGHAPQQQHEGGVGNYSPEEQEYYGQLWRHVDPGGKGQIDGATAAEFLTTSGLPQEVLRQIWEISDKYAQGVLTVTEFFVACRLVAHVQAGHAPSHGMEAHAPQMLPEFEGVQRRREHGETSPAPGSPAPSHQGARSDISELQPVIVGGAEEHQEQPQEQPAARRSSRQRGRSTSPKVFTHGHWAPSQREKRKYASLFLRTDSDNDGFVEGHEATDLLERSGLGRAQLGVAWEHADQDKDGRLNFPEFACLVHLVTCALRGAHMPGQHDGLPPDLIHSLVNLEPPDVLVAQREESRSRSASRGPSGHIMPGPGGDDGAEADAAAEVMADAAAWDITPAEGTGDFGFPEGDGFRDAPAEGGADEFGFAEGGGFGEGGGEEFGALAGENVAGGEEGFVDAFVEVDLEEVKELEVIPEPPIPLADLFSAVIAVDHEICKQLKREVDELHHEMGDVHEARNQVQQDLQQDHKDAGQLHSERARLTSQLAEAQRRLAGLREEKQSAGLASLFLNRDHGRYREEIEYLRKMAEGEQNSVEVIRRANQHLEKSYRSLEADCAAFERQCKELSHEVHREKELQRQAEASNAEFRSLLEQKREEQVAAVAGGDLAAAVAAVMGSPTSLVAGLREGV